MRCDRTEDMGKSFEFLTFIKLTSTVIGDIYYLKAGVVSYDCSQKVPHTRQHSTLEMCSLVVLRLEVQNQGVGRAVF